MPGRGRAWSRARLQATTPNAALPGAVGPSPRWGGAGRVASLRQSRSPGIPGQGRRAPSLAVPHFPHPPAPAQRPPPSRREARWARRLEKHTDLLHVNLMYKFIVASERLHLVYRPILQP